MAARVNKKVVIPLIVTLALVAAAAIAVSAFALRRTPEYHKNKGDAAAAGGDWRAAEDSYSKAVNKDQGNVAMLELWRESIAKIIPENAIEARQFYTDASSVIKTKSEIRPFEPQFHIDWLTHVLTVSLPEPSAADAAFLAAETENMLRSKPANDDNPLWEQAYRFRGIGGAYRMREAGLEPRLREQARTDLMRSIERDPSDSLAVEALIRWHLYDASDLAGRSKSREALARIDEARAVAFSHLERRADDVLIAHALAETYLSTATYERDLPDVSTDAMVQYRRALARTEELALARPSLEWWMARRLANDLLWAAEDRVLGVNRAAQLIEHALASNPDHPQLQFERARFLAMAGRRDDSMIAYQALIDSPNLPVSLTSVQLFATRPPAVLAQFDMDIDIWRSTPRQDSANLAPARSQAQARLETYRSLVSDADENLLYLEGRFALADGNPPQAASRLNQFLTTVGRRPIPTSQRLTSLLDLALALEQTNQPGAAYEYLEQASALTGHSHPPILRSLISLDITSRNFDRAEVLLAHLAEIDPENAALPDLRNSLELTRHGAEATNLDDPVMMAILRGRDLLFNDKADEARTVLLDAQAAAVDDLQILYELARLEYLQGTTAEALKHVDRALNLLDENQGGPGQSRHQWRLLRAMLEVEEMNVPDASGDGPNTLASVLEAKIRPILEEMVDERAGLSPIDAHLEKWRLFSSHGLADAALQHLDAARSLNARHPAVLEYDFVTALAREDLATAANLVQTAVETNADLASGLTFRGRLELHSDQPAQAVATFRQATTLKPYDSVPWRLLGLAHLSSGHFPPAAQALQESLKREPTNVITLKELAKLQFRTGDTIAALASIRKARAFAPGDVSIQSAWLDLEGRYGDRPKVIAARERIAASGQGPLDNSLSLVELHELDGRFEDARLVLDSLDEQAMTPANRLRLAQTRAAWHFKQGQVDDGRNVLLAFIDGLKASMPQGGDPATAAAHDEMSRSLISLTQYYIDAGRVNDAIETAQQAIPYQDSVRREADRSLGEIYLALRQMDKALESYERAYVEGMKAAKQQGGDSAMPRSPDALMPFRSLSIQMMNLHLVLAKQADGENPASAAGHRARAEAILDEHDKTHGGSVETALLRGELLFQNRDVRGAERAFNEAVAKYSQDARVYAARARFNVTQIIRTGEMDRAPRVRADVEQAMQISPGNDAPLLTLVDLAGARRNPQTGAPEPDVESLISTWRRILEVNPRNEEVRSNLVETLYGRGEFTQAQLLIQQAIELDPTRGAWHEIQGDLERNLGHPPEQYANQYGLAFEKQPSANRLLKLGRAWLSLKQPRAAQVIHLYRQFEKEVESLPSHRLLLAHAQALSNDQATALVTLNDAAVMISAQTDPAQRDTLMQEWFDTLAVVAAPDRFESMVREAFPAGEDPWPEALLGHILYEAAGRTGVADPSSLQMAGISRMAAARDRIKALPRGEERTGRLQRELGWALAGAYYSTGDHASAAETWRWILDVAPNHFATLNNLAYVLASHLDQAAQALDFAMRAYETNPTDPTMLDTYGYVLFRNGRLDEAERALRDSLNRADQSSAHMHLGEVLAARGDSEEARRELSRARTLAVQQNQTQRIGEIDDILKRLPN